MAEQQLIRTLDQGTYEAKSFKGWGKYFIKCNDPEAKYTSNQLSNSFVLSKNFPVIPAEIYTAIIKLYEHWVTNEKANSMEALVLLLRDSETLTKWRAIVPQQYISGGRVDGDNNISRDLLTGEAYTIFPQEGWLVAGSSHSHNTMGAFWSGRDDSDELPNPGLHMVTGEVGVINRTRASIVHHKQRYEIDVNKVMDTTLLADVSFHPSVLCMFKTLEESPQVKEKRVITTTRIKTRPVQYQDEYDYGIEYGGLYGSDDEAQSTLIHLDYLLAALAMLDKNTKYQAAKLVLEYLEPEVIQACGL
jgi:hypothetical protein